MKSNAFKKETIRSFFAAIVVLAACALLETFVWNNHLFWEAKLQTERVLPLDTASLSDELFYDGEAIVVTVGTETATITFSDCGIQSVSVTLQTAGKGAPEILTGKICISDDANSESLLEVQQVQFVPGGTGGTRTVRCESGGQLKKLQLTFSEPSADYRITGVVLNSHAIPFAFSAVRFCGLSALLFLLYLAARRGWVKKEYEVGNPRHELAVCCAAALCAAFCLFVVLHTAVVHDDNIYVQMIQAFRDGHLYLSRADASLSALPDVYDPSVRALSGVRYEWDRVYFNGYYYSYFGLAPLAVYYLCELFGGQLPGDSAVMLVLTLALILFLFLALREFVRAFHLRVNLMLFLFCSVAAVFGSFIFAVQSMASFYTMPAACAAVGTAAAVFFSCRAESCGRSWSKRLCYAMAGLAFAFVLAARPNVCLIVLAFCLPLYWRVLREPLTSLREKIADAASFALPALCAAFGVLYYNYARFGSFTDFGAWYQLTAYNTAFYQLKFTLHNFWLSVYHYFLQLPGLDSQFPFFVFTNTGNGVEGFYKYFNVDYAGILIMPLNLALLLLWRSLKKKPLRYPDGAEKAKKPLMLTAAVAIVFIAFFNYCMAGINLRYVLDISIAAVLLSALLVFDQSDRLQPGSFCYRAVCVVCVLTVVSGTLLTFNNADLLWRVLSPDSYLAVSDFFMGIAQ